MEVRIKVVSLKKAREIDNVICGVWSNFPPLYWLPEEIFGQELEADISPEKVTVPWFCYFTESGWYIPNVYVEAAEEL